MAQTDKELAALEKRVAFVMAYRRGDSISAVARKHKTSRDVVRHWIDRFNSHGTGGLIDRPPSKGRPRIIDEAVRKEVVRLAKETRPPADLSERNEQWTTRTLGKALGISPAEVSLIWKEEGFDPPSHLQQVKRNPDKPERLRLALKLPAWLKMHLEMHLARHGWSMEEYLLARLTGDHTPDDMPPLPQLREEVLANIRSQSNEVEWLRCFLRRPIEDPRRVSYRRRLDKEEQ